MFPADAPSSRVLRLPELRVHNLVDEAGLERFSTTAVPSSSAPELLLVIVQLLMTTVWLVVGGSVQGSMWTTSSLINSLI